MQRKEIIKQLKAIRSGIVKTQKAYDKQMGFYWEWMGKIIKDSELSSNTSSPTKTTEEGK